MTDEVYKAKMDAMASLAKGFYHDFMPVVRQIKDDVSVLNISEEDNVIINHINEQLQKAESLLRQLMTISVRSPETDMTEVALNIIKDENLKNNPALRGGRLIAKIDENYTYVQSETEGKIDLLDKNYVKIKEIDIEELEK